MNGRHARIREVVGGVASDVGVAVRAVRGRRRGTAIFSAALSSFLVAAIALTVSACAPEAGPVPAPAESPPGLTGELTIFAAASLNASFTELAKKFGDDNPGVTVRPISFDGSSTLATQIKEGAPADVFASADEANMSAVSDLVDGTATVFASNVLQIVVHAGNPMGIERLSDLAKPHVKTVMCAPQVPCGAAAHKLFDFDGVQLTPVSEEQNVTAVLTKVQLGEADAGLVYRTDVTAAASAGNAVEGVNIAGADRAVNFYPIATMAASKSPDVATAFVTYVLSPAGKAVLAKYGFGAP